MQATARRTASPPEDGCRVWGPLVSAVLGLVVAGGCSSTTDARPRFRIEIAPSSVSLSVHDQTALRASVVDATGRTVPNGAVFWSTEDASIATISPTGLVTGESPGRARVAASAEGVTGTATVTVSAPVIASVAIVPQNVTVLRGATAQLQAAAYDQSGHAIGGLSTQWGSSDQSIATVDASGLVTGVNAGRTVVTAAIAGQFASATIVVTSPGGGGGGGGDGHHHHHGHHGGGGNGGNG